MPDTDIYGNAYVPPEYSGYEDENFDGEDLVDRIVGLDNPVWLHIVGDDFTYEREDEDA